MGGVLPLEIVEPLNYFLSPGPALDFINEAAEEPRNNGTLQISDNQVESPKGCRQKGVPTRKGLKPASGGAEHSRARMATQYVGPSAE